MCHNTVANLVSTNPPIISDIIVVPTFVFSLFYLSPKLIISPCTLYHIPPSEHWRCQVMKLTLIQKICPMPAQKKIQVYSYTASCFQIYVWHNDSGYEYNIPFVIVKYQQQPLLKIYSLYSYPYLPLISSRHYINRFCIQISFTVS